MFGVDVLVLTVERYKLGGGKTASALPERTVPAWWWGGGEVLRPVAPGSGKVLAAKGAA